MSDLIKDLTDACMCGEVFYSRPCIYCQSRERIAELEADVARLREQRDSLQAKVHLCTAYDYLEKRVAELEGDLEVMRLQRDAKRWTKENHDV